MGMTTTYITKLPPKKKRNHENQWHELLHLEFVGFGINLNALAVGILWIDNVLAFEVLWVVNVLAVGVLWIVNVLAVFNLFVCFE